MCGDVEAIICFGRKTSQDGSFGISHTPVEALEVSPINSMVPQGEFW